MDRKRAAGVRRFLSAIVALSILLSLTVGAQDATVGFAMSEPEISLPLTEPPDSSGGPRETDTEQEEHILQAPDVTSDAILASSGDIVPESGNAQTEKGIGIDENGQETIEEEKTIVSIKAPNRVRFTFDPLNSEGRGQIFSDSLQYKNNGNVDLLLEIVGVSFQLADGVTALKQPIASDEAVTGKAVYLGIRSADGTVDFPFFGDSSGTLASVVLSASYYNESGDWASYASGSVLELSFYGDLAASGAEQWQEGDVKVSLEYVATPLLPESQEEEVVAEDPLPEPEPEPEEPVEEPAEQPSEAEEFEAEPQPEQSGDPNAGKPEEPKDTEPATPDPVVDEPAPPSPPPEPEPDSGTWMDYAADGFSTGDGSALSPYEITQASELAKLARDIVLSGEQYAGTHFILKNDIDLAGHVWQPMVALDTSEVDESPQEEPVIQGFAGVFDGGYHYIRNMTVEAEAYGGLFGYLENAEVRNLAVVDAQVSGGEHTGILAGFSVGSTVERCFTGGETSGAGLVGTLAGSRVGNSYASAVFGSESQAGAGLVGLALEGSIIHNSFVITPGDAPASRDAGFVGVQDGGSGIYNSFAAAAVTDGFGFARSSGMEENQAQTPAQLEGCYYLSEQDEAGQPLTVGIGQVGAYANAAGLTHQAQEFFRDPATYINNENWYSDGEGLYGWGIGSAWEVASDVNGGYPHLLGFEYPIDDSVEPLALEMALLLDEPAQDELEPEDVDGVDAGDLPSDQDEITEPDTEDSDDQAVVEEPSDDVDEGIDGSVITDDSDGGEPQPEDTADNDMGDSVDNAATDNHVENIDGHTDGTVLEQSQVDAGLGQ